MSIIDKIRNIQYQFANDPQSKKKLLTYIIIAAVLGGFLILLFVLNSSGSQTEDEKLLSDQSKIENLENNLITFDSYNGKEKLSKIKVNDLFDVVGFSLDGEFSYLDKESKLVVDGKIVEFEEGGFFPNSIYYTDDGVVINNMNKQVYYYENEGSSIEKYDSNIVYVVPDYSRSILKGYYYIELEGEAVYGQDAKLMYAKDLELKRNQEEIGSFISDTEQELEIKVLDKKPYIFVKEEFYNSSNLYITSFDEESELQLDQDISNFVSSSYSDEKFLVTVNDSQYGGVDYKTILLDFSSTEVEATLIDMTIFLEEYGIKGNILADRCAVYDSEDAIVCAIKKDLTTISDEDKRDILIKYDYQKEEVEILYPGVVFMVKDIFLNEGNLHILNQRDNLVYKLK